MCGTPCQNSLCRPLSWNASTQTPSQPSFWRQRTMASSPNNGSPSSWTRGLLVYVLASVPGSNLSASAGGKRTVHKAMLASPPDGRRTVRIPTSVTSHFRDSMRNSYLLFSSLPWGMTPNLHGFPDPDTVTSHKAGFPPSICILPSKRTWGKLTRNPHISEPRGGVESDHKRPFAIPFSVTAAEVQYGRDNPSSDLPWLPVLYVQSGCEASMHDTVRPAIWGRPEP